MRGRGSPRRAHFGAMLLLLLTAATAAGCASVVNPQGWAPPHLAEDTLYASIDSGKMAALDPDDLSVKWVFPPDTEEGDELDLEAIYGTPIVDEGVVYFGAYDGNVYALDAAACTTNPDGCSSKWIFSTDDPIIGSLALKDGTLYIGSADGHLYSLDIASCTSQCPPAEQVPSFDTGSEIWSSPTVVDDVVYVGDTDGRLHALDAGNVAEEVEGFSFQADAGLLTDPILGNKDTLLVGGIDTRLYALDAASGDEKWSFTGGNWFWAQPLVDGQVVYAADLDGNVHALGLDDGKPLWPDAFRAQAAIRSAPLLAGDTLFVVGRDGNAYGLDPENGGQRWGPTLLGKTVLSDPFLLGRSASSGETDSSPSATPTGGSPPPTPDSSPTPTAGDRAAGEVLISAQGGDLCLIDPRDGSLTSPCVQVPL